MLKLRSAGITMDSGNAWELCDFYHRLLGGKKHESGCGLYVDLLDSKQPGAPIMGFQEFEDYEPPVWPEEPGKQQTMVHWDFCVDDVAEGVKHALSCGAVLAEAQYGGDDYQTLIDPAGHPFCIMKYHAPPAE
ncbi:MAG: VOC family protein [Oscillospiraceae bacterium]|jgi:hypothetical protein|nr:VOC family protein [Oscillospiraceae bacterium]